ncbi:helix-turn-helix transcriptional regulator [Gudongella sp. SC589]|uniref:helix-turn-helix transcriptional regulator n=1 Tax=Gudongella sp. SC589 TaxID=3385990 RepID=UPI0039046B44
MGGDIIQLSNRQNKIIDIVNENQPITSTAIAKKLGLTRATIRPDLSILTMTGILDARPKVGYIYLGRPDTDIIANRISSIKVKDVMSLPVVMEEDRTIYDAVVYMFTEDVGSIYVTQGGCLSGVISRKDLLRSAVGGMDLNKTPVGMIMTRIPKLVVIRESDTILKAAIKLIEHEIDSLPVVEETGDSNRNLKVIGRITKTNITRMFVELGTNI